MNRNNTVTYLVKRKPHYCAALFILLVSLLFAALIAHPSAYKELSKGDAPTYLLPALNIASGKGFSIHEKPYVGREPGYSFLIAGGMLIFGKSERTAWITNAILHSLAMLLLCRMLIEIIPKREAVLFVLVIAFNPWIFPRIGLCLKEVAAEFATILSVYVCFSFGMVDCKATPFAYMIKGFILGLAILINSILMFFPFLAVTLLVLKSSFHKRTIYFALCLIFGCATALLPWSIRNLSISDGKFCFINTHIGNVLYSSTVSAETFDKYGFLNYPEYLDAINELEVKGPITEFERDKGLRNLAILRIKERPFEYFRLVIIRMYRFWTLEGLAWFNHMGILPDFHNSNPDISRNRYVVLFFLRGVAKISFWVINLVFICGTLWFILKRQKGVFITLSIIMTWYYFFIYSILYVDVRYILPVYPLIMACSFIFIQKLLKYFSKKIKVSQAFGVTQRMKY